MCTNFVLKTTPSVDDLARLLGVDSALFQYSDNHKPGSVISIVTGGNSDRMVHNALWWLYLKQTPEGLKPHPDYFSVNTNYRKLPQKTEFKTHRCVVPVSAFAESQGGKRPHLLMPDDGSAMAFGGLWKEWTDQTTGEKLFSASVITLPGHPALEHIHRKSTPLWLPAEAIDMWLDPTFANTAAFNELLTPALRTPLRAIPIDKVWNKQPIGQPELIERN